MQVIPTQPVPAQTLNINLGGQSCSIRLYTLSSGLYCDLYVNNSLIIGGVVCQNENKIVRDAYLGFIGDLGFIDNSGQGEDPVYMGLGSQFSFVYLSPADVTVPV